MNTDTLQRPDPQGAPAPSPADYPTERPAADDSIKSAFESVKETAGEQVHQAASGIREGGEEVVQAAKTAGVDLVTQQKEKIAAKIDEYTCAVRAACESLKEDEKNPLAGPAERASEQLERAAQYLRNKNPGDLLHDLGDFARRRPEVMYGAMFVAGLASVRFLKASSHERGNRGNPGFDRVPPAALPPTVQQTSSNFQP
jgi:hypothetical protein